MTWLITGGAGYIGSHVVDLFLSDNQEVVICDSLYKGLKSRVEYLEKKHKRAIPFISADIRDVEKITAAIKEFNIKGIVHTAALKSVEESMSQRDLYIEVNVDATKTLLEIAMAQGVKSFIFSSSAAVYGSPATSAALKESDSTNPISPYGESKLMAEELLNDFLKVPGNFGTALRFFNVVGTSALELIDNSTENLVPIVLSKLRNNQAPVIFGDDYETPDGTCIRDYVDVRDIATAHLLASKSQKLPSALNVGTGQGASVNEIVTEILKVVKSEVKPIVTERRAGDSANLFADISLAKQALNFSPRYSLSQSVKSLFAS